jgi:cystathionine beta-lyase
MKYDFDQFINRRESESIKWNLYEADVLPLWVADTDFLSPPSIISSLRDRIDHGIFGYAKPQDSTKQTIQLWLDKRHNWKVNLVDIVLIPGVVQGFNVAAKTYTNPGDSILFQTPAYHPFFNVAQNSNLIQITSPLSCDPSGSYKVIEDDFQSSVTPETRIFLLCNPQNPTGRAFSKSELLSMAKVCLKHKILICSDEIHSDLVFPETKHIPIASLSEDISNITITLLSASKTFNIAGLNSSAAVITNPILRERFIQTTNGFSGSVNLLGEIAMRTAFENGEDWLNKLLSYLEANRNLLFDFVQAELPGVHMSKPESTYLGWLDCGDTGLRNLSGFFLEQAHVALNDGSWFGEEYNNFVRLNFGCPQERLLTGLERMRTALLQR